MVSQECAVCDGRISRFIKEQEANESWGRLGIKIAILSKLPTAGDISF